MKEKTLRKGLGKLVGRIFGKKSKRQYFDENQKNQYKHVVETPVKSIFRKKIKVSYIGKPGHKMSNRLAKSMTKYMIKKNGYCNTRRMNKKARDEYLGKDRYYCACKDALYGRKTA